MAEMSLEAILETKGQEVADRILEIELAHEMFSSDAISLESVENAVKNLTEALRLGLEADECDYKLVYGEGSMESIFSWQGILDFLKSVLRWILSKVLRSITYIIGGLIRVLARLVRSLTTHDRRLIADKEIVNMFKSKKSVYVISALNSIGISLNFISHTSSLGVYLKHFGKSVGIDIIAKPVWELFERIFTNKEFDKNPGVELADNLEVEINNLNKTLSEAGVLEDSKDSASMESKVDDSISINFDKRAYSNLVNSTKNLSKTIDKMRSNLAKLEGYIKDPVISLETKNYYLRVMFLVRKAIATLTLRNNELLKTTNSLVLLLEGNQK